MTPIAKTAVRVSVILLACAGAAGHVAYLDALWWHSLGLTSTLAMDVPTATIVLWTLHAIVSVTCSVLGVLLVLTEGPRPQAARALAVAFGAWSYLMAYSGVTMLFRPATPGMTREIFEAHFLVVEVLGLAGLVRFTSLFPRVLHDDELQPLETLPRPLLPFHHASVGMRHPSAPPIAGLAVLGVLWSWTLATGGGLSDAGLSRAMDVVRLCAAGVVVMHLRRAWSVATEGDRDGLTWLLVALSVLLGSLAILIGSNVLVAVTGFPEPDMAWRPIVLDLGLLGFLTVLAMAVLYRGPMDPATVTRRIMAFTFVMTLGLFLAAGLEALFTAGSTTFALRTGVGTAVAFAVVLSTYRTLSAAIESVLPV